MLTRKMDESLEGKEIRCVKPVKLYCKDVSIVGEVYKITEVNSCIYRLNGVWKRSSSERYTGTHIIFSSATHSDPSWDDVEAAFVLVEKEPEALKCPRCGKLVGVDTGKGSKYRDKPWECWDRACGWIEAEHGWVEKEHDDILSELSNEALEIFQELNGLYIQKLKGEKQ